MGCDSHVNSEPLVVESRVEKRKVLRLDVSEGIVVQVAGQIYAAYIAAGRVPESEEKLWMERSIREAIQIAQTVENAVQSDSELG